MREDLPDDKPKSINRRNLVMVLGGLGALLLIANVGERDTGFFDSDDRPRVSIDIDDEDTESIDEAFESIEERIESRIEDRIESRIETSASDAEMKAAIEELRTGDPARFNKLMDEYRAEQ